MKKLILLVFVISMCFFNTTAYGNYHWDIFTTFESILLNSDLIIIGEVTDSYTNRVGVHLKRYSTVTVEQVVYSRFNAKETNNNPIGFSKLKTYVASACSLWNIIDDTNIHFTVHPDSFPTLSTDYDSLSVICFIDTLYTSWGACVYR